LTVATTYMTKYQLYLLIRFRTLYIGSRIVRFFFIKVHIYTIISFLFLSFVTRFREAYITLHLIIGYLSFFRSYRFTFLFFSHNLKLTSFYFSSQIPLDLPPLCFLVASLYKTVIHCVIILFPHYLSHI